mmetsp:Transcript_29807/g.39172  ORF Transcript_29807/g.39172 Transcript_29807/m.39172 type:complete len:441 (-) Transcript_29807:118-1440(-)
MLWRRRKIAPGPQIPPPPPPIFCPPTSPLTSEEKAKACEEIEVLLSANPVDLEALREKAFSVGGFQLQHLRDQAWPKLLQVTSEEGQSFREKIVEHSDTEQVRRDVERSLWHWHRVRRWGHSRLTQKRNKLSDIINAVISAHPGLHYFQGYHDLIGVLLLILSNENVTYAAAERLSLTYHRESMREDFQQVTLQLQLLHPILKYFDRQLFEFLEDVQLEPFYAISWVLTWFAHDISELDLVARLFDVFLSSDPMFSLYLSAAVLVHRREEILTIEADFGILHNSLIKLPVNLDYEAVLKRARIMIELLPPKLLLFTVEKTLREEIEEQRLAFLEYPAPWKTKLTEPDWILLEEKRVKMGKKKRNRRARAKQAKRKKQLQKLGRKDYSQQNRAAIFPWKKFKILPARTLVFAVSIAAIACIAAARIHSKMRCQSGSPDLLG